VNAPAPARIPHAIRLARMSIRTRLAAWSGAVVFLALLAAGGTVLWLQVRLGLARVDAELDSAAVAVAGVFGEELGERHAAEPAVQDMLEGLNLTRAGFAVLAPDGRVLGSKPLDQPAVSAAVLQAAGDRTFTADGGPAGVRVRATTVRSRGFAIRIVTWTSLAPLAEERRSLERAMLLGIPLTVLVSILGGLWIARRALGPLSELAHQAEVIDARDRGARLSLPEQGDELSTLAGAFNRLLERLAAGMQQQRAFMADASHQLRTPVSVIRTAAEVTLSRAARTDGEYRESLDVVARQAQRLSRMVDDMFVLARADADARPLQLAPVYLDEIAQDVVADCQVLARSRQTTLALETGGDAPFVGDEHLLRQMLMNLIDNALRHTPRGGTVLVSLRTRDGGGWRLQVVDTGGGVPDGDAERIFDRFVRHEAPGSDAGAGLGLPIARWIAEAHGGSLTLERTGPQGSRFAVLLPAAEPAGR
jgi:two-component system OmpR family sensor kinase